MLHSGIDLPKRTVVLSTVDPQGQRVADAQLPTTRTAVQAYFAAHPGPHRAVVESTATWYWLRDLLVPLGVDLKLGHSKYIKAISLISCAKVKTDAVDAHTLAQLLRNDLIPEGHMISAAHREERDLLRARLRLVSQQVRCRVTVEGLLAQYNVTSVGALPELVQWRVEMLAQQRALLTAQIKRIEPALVPRLVPTPDAQRLLYIPGIGKIVAFTVLLEIDDIARFPTVKDFVSYCRLVPAAKNSGGKVRQQRSKDGNKYLKLAFHHAAVRAIQYFPEIQRFYRSTARRKPKALARALVAKELARAVYFVLTRQEAFNGTFKGTPLSRIKTPKWPRLANPPV
jgi:transposase